MLHSFYQLVFLESQRNPKVFQLGHYDQTHIIVVTILRTNAPEPMEVVMHACDTSTQEGKAEDCPFKPCARLTWKLHAPTHTPAWVSRFGTMTKQRKVKNLPPPGGRRGSRFIASINWITNTKTQKHDHLSKCLPFHSWGTYFFLLINNSTYIILSLVKKPEGNNRQCAMSKMTYGIWKRN